MHTVSSAIYTHFYAMCVGLFFLLDDPIWLPSSAFYSALVRFCILRAPYLSFKLQNLQCCTYSFLYIFQVMVKIQDFTDEKKHVL